jgi:hypothetical protein
VSVYETPSPDSSVDAHRCSRPTCPRDGALSRVHIRTFLGRPGSQGRPPSLSFGELAPQAERRPQSAGTCPMRASREKASDALVRLVNSVHGLLCIVVSDRDGVELHRTVRDEGSPVVLAPALLATFALTAEQVGKLQLGEGSITSIYDNLVVVHSSAGSFTICMVAETDANIGLAMALMPDVKAIFVQ